MPESIPGLPETSGLSGATIGIAVAILIVIIVLFIISIFAKCYKKVEQGKALIRNGGRTKVSFSGMMVYPIFHKMEIMDISVKRVEIDRMGQNGLICKDNMRADVKVAFFVQVNKDEQSVLRVAQSLGCDKSSNSNALVEFFDAKFSEALKTVGKQFDFIELYNNRQAFKDQILAVIGTDLNGYQLDDAAIDYLEQTDIKHMDPNNILDSEGIKKITELTAKQAVFANDIEQNKLKTMKKQNVEAREAVLQLEKQQAEAEHIQRREVAEIAARQTSEAQQVQQQERLKAERARITSDEEIAVAEENRQRQIIVAAKNKERTTAVETERVEKDRALEATERERTVTLAQIEKEKAVEVEKRNIQEVIRERVNVERSVVEQEEKIKDTKDFAAAERSKKVALTLAEEQAEQEKIKLVKMAEANKEASDMKAKEEIIIAEGKRAASEKEADARKIIADATAQEEAVKGLGEARALEARAEAQEKYGMAEARVVESKAVAEAKGKEADAAATEKHGLAEAAVIESKTIAAAKGKEAEAVAIEKQGTAEANIMQLKFQAEAKGIEEKAAAMKRFDDVGKAHEEFKLRLEKEKEVELAQISIQTEIAKAQAAVVAEALKNAHIDIVGGESQFFDKIVSSVTAGKMVDRVVDNSQVLSDIRTNMLGDKTQNLILKLKDAVAKSGIESGDIKNLSVAALLSKMIMKADDDSTVSLLGKLSDTAAELGIGDQNAAGLLKDIKV